MFTVQTAHVQLYGQASSATNLEMSTSNQLERLLLHRALLRVPLGGAEADTANAFLLRIPKARYLLHPETV